MKLAAEQLQEIERNGFLLIPDLFSHDEVAAINAALEPLFAETSEANVREKDSGEVRTAMGLHLRNALFDKLCRHPRLVEPAQQILGDDLYIQQVKVNVKAAFEGEAWQWHYDFATHHADDGVPQPLALNLHIFLADVTEFNGPLWFIKGSHRHGAQPTFHDTVSTSYPLWVVDRDVVADLAAKGGMVSATGKTGTGLIFHDTLLHCSPPNLSPHDRPIFSLILNPVSNRQTTLARPEYKHHTDFAPVRAIADDCLVM